MNISDLVIDNYPKLNIDKKTLSTEYNINSNKDISISLNNAIILSNNNISEVKENVIFLQNEVEISSKDVISVIYYVEI